MVHKLTPAYKASSSINHRFSSLVKHPTSYILKLKSVQSFVANQILSGAGVGRWALQPPPCTRRGITVSHLFIIPFVLLLTYSLFI